MIRAPAGVAVDGIMMQAGVLTRGVSQWQKTTKEEGKKLAAKAESVKEYEKEIAPASGRTLPPSGLGKTQGLADHAWSSRDANVAGKGGIIQANYRACQTRACSGLSPFLLRLSAKGLSSTFSGISHRNTVAGEVVIF